MFKDRNEVLKMNKEDVIIYLKTLPAEDLSNLRKHLKDKMGEDKNSGRQFMLTRAWIGNREFGPATRKTSTSFSEMFDALFEEEDN